MTEHLITTRSGLTLWTESFGETTDPLILLVSGGAAQGISWPDELCQLLISPGYRVVRYDHRDTGRSSMVDHHQNPYDLSDLAEDAADVIRAYGQLPAHVIGQSMGGMVAQLLALQDPSLVRSLALLSSSPDANGDVTRPPATGLPGPRQAMLDHVEAMTRNPPHSRSDEVTAQVAGWQVLVGPVAPFSEPYWRDLVERSIQRTENPGAAGYHRTALDRTPALTCELPAIQAPTLVVHGGQDDVFPVEHGRALSAAIGPSQLVEIDEMGHVFPPQWCSVVNDLLQQHLGPADRAGVSAVAGWRTGQCRPGEPIGEAPASAGTPVEETHASDGERAAGWNFR